MSLDIPVVVSTIVVVYVVPLDILTEASIIILKSLLPIASL